MMGRLIIMLISDFCRGLLGEGTLTTDENVVTIYVPEGQKWKLADIKSDMSNILLNGCEIENGAVQTDSGDVFFKIVISII